MGALLLDMGRFHSVETLLHLLNIGAVLDDAYVLPVVTVSTMHRQSVM